MEDRTRRRAERIEMQPDIYEQDLIALGYRVGDLIFTSGQVSRDENGDVVGEGDFEAQAHQVFQNLARVLEAAGSSLDKVIKINVYVSDVSFFPTVVAMRRTYFREPWPADTIVGVASLAGGPFMIEAEVIAFAGGDVVGYGKTR